MIRPVHSNKDRIFTTAEMQPAVSPSPSEKFYRFRPDPDIQKLADELRKYIIRYNLSRYHFKLILIPKFGESIGHETLEIFLDPVYGAGMRPRKSTLIKYRYLLSRLKEIHKDFEDNSSCYIIEL